MTKLMLKLLLLPVLTGGLFPLGADTCTNPAASWTNDWEYAGIKRYYKLVDRDQDGRFEEVSIQFRNVSGKRMRVSFVWKGRSLGEVFTSPKPVSLLLEKGAVVDTMPDLTINIPGDVMRSSNTCFAGFYADAWKIEEDR